MKTIGKIILVLLFFLAGILSSMAQDYTINGNVSDEDGIPVMGISVVATTDGLGAFLNEVALTNQFGNYEIVFPTANISGAETILVTIIDCDGNPQSTVINITFIPVSQNVNFIYCDEDNTGGSSNEECSAEFSVLPFDEFSPFSEQNDSHVLLADYYENDEDSDLIYTWTINDQEIIVNDVPYLPFQFQEEGEYQICLSIESEDCIASDCQTINITNQLIGGCLDPVAINFNPVAAFDDGSCVYDCSAMFDVFPAEFGSAEFNFIVLYPNFIMETSWQISNNGFEDSFDGNDQLIQYEFPASGVYQVCLTIETLDCIETFCQNVSVVIDGNLPQGCTDPDATNFNPFALLDDGSCYYSDPVICAPGQQMIRLEITTDEFPEDISWAIINADNGEVYLTQEEILGSDGAPFLYLPHQTYVHEMCIPEQETLLFIINDAANDGLCCSYGLGSFELTACGIVIFEGSNFGSDFVGLIEFCEGVELISGCTDNNAINFNPLANWDNGSCTYATSAECFAEFFVLPIAVSEEVLTVFVGDINPEFSNEWSWTVDGLNSTDPYDYFVLDGYGTYEICLTTNNGMCEDTACQEITFTENDTGLLEFSYLNLGNLNFNFSSQLPSAGFDESVFRFKWTIDNNHVFYDQNFNFTFPETGMYDVCLEIISEKAGIVFEHCESIPAFGLDVEELKITKIELYPNPTSDGFHLKNAQDIDNIRIININGQIVKQQAYMGQKIQVSSLPTGMYILELTKNTAEKEFIRFSKQ